MILKSVIDLCIEFSFRAGRLVRLQATRLLHMFFIPVSSTWRNLSALTPLPPSYSPALPPIRIPVCHRVTSTFPLYFLTIFCYQEERSTVRVECLAQEYNTMTQPRLIPRYLNAEPLALITERRWLVLISCACTCMSTIWMVYHSPCHKQSYYSWHKEHILHLSFFQIPQNSMGLLMSSKV